MANATITVLEADGVTETDCVVLDVGRQAAAASKSVGLATEDKSQLDAAVTALQIIDNIVSGSEAQVDVVTLPVSFGGGADDATTQRVVIADEQFQAAGPLAKAASTSVTLATDEDTIEVFGTTKFVTVTMTTPSDAQDAGDVIAATQIVAACTPGNDVPAILQSATLIDTDDVGVNVKAVFFSANTSLGTEDSAPDIDDTEALTVLGIVDFAAADFVDLGGSKYNTKSNIGLAVSPATGTDDIYMALYSPTGGTWASQAITVRLGFI